MTVIKLDEAPEVKAGTRKVVISLSSDLIEVLDDLANKEGCSTEAFIVRVLITEALAYRVRRRS